MYVMNMHLWSLWSWGILAAESILWRHVPGCLLDSCTVSCHVSATFGDRGSVDYWCDPMCCSCILPEHVCLPHPVLWISAPPWTSRGCKGIAASPWAVPWAAQESQLWHLQCLLPLLLHWPWCLQCCSFHMVSLLSSLVTITSVQ